MIPFGFFVDRGLCVFVAVLFAGGELRMFKGNNVVFLERSQVTPEERLCPRPATVIGFPTFSLCWTGIWAWEGSSSWWWEGAG